MTHEENEEKRHELSQLNDKWKELNDKLVTQFQVINQKSDIKM